MKRIYHTWDKWECYPAGFYEPKPPAGMSQDEARQEYARFLRNIPRFTAAMQGVLRDWPNSCEHYLSNERMNRIAWLGQAACCYDTGISREYRGGYNLLSDDEKRRADEAALEVLNQWLASRGEEPFPDLIAAASRTQADLY